MKFLVVFILCSCSVLTYGQFSLTMQESYELENVISGTQTENWRWRSEAYGNKTLRLNYRNQTANVVELTMCIEPFYTEQNVTVVIADVRYSNDGPDDDLYFRIDGIEVGQFTTRSKFRYGHEWNIFRNSGVIGTPINMAPGQYLMQIQVAPDMWGVELDRIRVNAKNQTPMTKVFCAGRLL